MSVCKIGNNIRIMCNVKKTWTELPHLSLMVVGNLKMKIWGAAHATRENRLGTLSSS